MVFTLDEYITTFDQHIGLSVLPLLIECKDNNPQLFDNNYSKTPQPMKVYSMMNTLLNNPYFAQSEKGTESFQTDPYHLFVFRLPSSSPTRTIYTKTNQTSFLHSIYLRDGSETGQYITICQDHLEALDFERWCQIHHKELILDLTVSRNIELFRQGMKLPHHNYDEESLPPLWEQYQDLLLDFQSEHDWRISPIEGKHRLLAALHLCLFTPFDMLRGEEGYSVGTLSHEELKKTGLFDQRAFFSTKYKDLKILKNDHNRYI